VEENPRRIRDVMNTMHFVRVSKERAKQGYVDTDKIDPSLLVKIDKVGEGGRGAR